MWPFSALKLAKKLVMAKFSRYLAAAANDKMAGSKDWHQASCVLHIEHRYWIDFNLFDAEVPSMFFFYKKGGKDIILCSKVKVKN